MEAYEGSMFSRLVDDVCGPGLPLRFSRHGHEFILSRDSARLQLSMSRGSLQKCRVHAEFVRGAAAYRRRHGGRELLRRALGIRADRAVTVLDATGGLGRDAFQTALFGCRVHLFERDRVVAALLADGLDRALAHEETRTAAMRISLTCGDSLDRIGELETRPDRADACDVIYLDPMFPARNKTALVKKEMQLLQALLGHDDQPESLLAAALAAPVSRVVVKRPARAPALPGPKPSHAIRGKTTRFDVYLMPMPKKSGTGPAGNRSIQPG